MKEAILSTNDSLIALGEGLTKYLTHRIRRIQFKLVLISEKEYGSSALLAHLPTVGLTDQPAEPQTSCRCSPEIAWEVGVKIGITGPTGKLARTTKSITCASNTCKSKFFDRIQALNMISYKETDRYNICDFASQMCSVFMASSPEFHSQQPKPLRNQFIKVPLLQCQRLSH